MKALLKTRWENYEHNDKMTNPDNITPAPYKKYKPTQIQGLGQVPHHWEERSLGQAGTLAKGLGGNKEDERPEGLPCVRYGDLYTTHRFFIEETRSFISQEDRIKYTGLKLGDVLFAASGETTEEIGKSAVNLMEEPAYCGGDVILFRPTAELHPKYCGYVLDCQPMADQKAIMGRGFTVHHIYGRQLKYLRFPIPPSDEQAAIVRFLDHADGQIQRYIAAKERLIALLEEERQALVHQAVTRGLDPNVRLKPSGVEWLGEVPKHWEVGPLKRAFGSMDYGISESASHLGAIPLLTMGNLRDGQVIVPHEGGVDSVDPYLLLREGDLLFNRTNSRELVGKVGLFTGHDSPTTFASYLVRMRPNSNHEPEYLNMVLNDTSFISSARRESVPSLHQSNLNPTRYGRLHIALPPREEQSVILRVLQEETVTLRNSVARTRRQIDLMNEYRTRLIADVVTGQLDVREAAAQNQVAS